MISHRLWQAYFEGDPAVLGRTVRVNRHKLTIIGVASPEFRGSIPGISFDGWVALPLTGDRDRGARGFRAVVRLKHGVSISEANAEAAPVAARLAQAHPKKNEGIGARIVPIWKAQSGVSGILASPLAILAAACGLVLLVACANVANLLLARSAARQSEFAIRTALGAGPTRLSRQLLCESLLIAAVATLVALPLALWCQNTLRLFVPPTGLPLYFGVDFNARVFLFVALICLHSALLSGIPPAFQSVRRSMVHAIKSGGRGDTQSARSQRVSGFFVVCEVGLALAALVTFGLFVRSLHGLQDTPSGFDARNVTLCRLFLVTNNYTAAPGAGVFEATSPAPPRRARLTGAAYSDSVPLGFGLGKWTDVGVRAMRPGPARTWMCITPPSRQNTSI